APSASPAPLPGPGPIRAQTVSNTPGMEIAFSSPNKVETSVPASSPVQPALASNLMELWSKLLEAVGRVSQFTRSYLLEADPVSFEKGVLTIGFDPEFADHIGLVDNPRNHTLLQTKLLELGHPNAQFKFVQAEAKAREAVPPG